MEFLINDLNSRLFRTEPTLTQSSQVTVSKWFERQTEAKSLTTILINVQRFFDGHSFRFKS